jgi:hypothetical protein
MRPYHKSQITRLFLDDLTTSTRITTHPPDVNPALVMLARLCLLPRTWQASTTPYGRNLGMDLDMGNQALLRRGLV